jgi:hypothetical protein
MKRLTLKPLFIAVMATLAAPTSFCATSAAPVPSPVPVPVIVINPATNPVKTSIDQYPRTPVAVDLAGDAQSESYTVPDGSRFVIETVTLTSNCKDLPTTTLGKVAINNGDNGLLFIPLQLVSTFAGNEYAATVSVRLVASPNSTVRFEGVSCDVSRASIFASLYGYLISVNSPSLAP